MENKVKDPTTIGTEWVEEKMEEKAWIVRTSVGNWGGGAEEGPKRKGRASDKIGVFMTAIM